MSMEVGIMLRGQYPFGADMAKMARELVEQACLADRLGYASILSLIHI